MADHSWDAHRAELEQLYIQDNKTLKYITEFMSSKGFRKTKSQYETQFTKWGLRKKQTVPRNANWEFIAKRVEKRKRLGKENEVVIDGEMITPEKLRKLQYGKTFVSTADRFSGYGAPSPKTPEGVVVRTPPSSIAIQADQAWCGGLSLTWNVSLPWLQFIKLLQLNQDQDQSALSSVAPIPLSSEVRVQSDIEKAELTQRLEYAFPLETRSQLRHMDVDSRIRAMLTVLMPEEYKGQHQLTQTNCLSIELYMLSNNIMPYDQLRSSEAQEKRLLAIIRTFGWHKGGQFKTLLASQEPTVEAIVEKIFASAVCEVDIEVMKLILEAGMDPNSLVEGLTPLQWAISIRNSRGAEMAELLVSHKADIELNHTGNSALTEAIWNDNEGVIQVLLRHNAVVNQRCPAVAAGNVDPNLFEGLLTPCDYINGLIYNELQEDGDSALFQAICDSNKEVIEVLLRHNVAVNLRCLAEATRTVDTNLFEKLFTSCSGVNSLIYHTAIGEYEVKSGYITLLGAAARSGSLKMIETILRLCPSLVNPRELEATGGPGYFSPISVAIANNNTDALKALLDAGVDTNFVNGFEKPPIERALERHNLRAYKILVESGATITQPLSYKILHVLMSFTSGEENCVSTMKRLVDESIQLSRNAAEWSREVLAEAINRNDLLVIRPLLDSGATIDANKVAFLSKETAQYLDTRGALQAILDGNGPKTLLTVLVRRDWDLAQWLLVREPALLHESLDYEPMPLSLAAFSKQPDLVKLMDYEPMPLSLAAFSKQPDLVKLMDYEPMPLSLAAFSKQPDLVKFMLKHGARVTDRAIFMATKRIKEDGESRSDEAFKVLRLLLSDFNGPAPNAIVMAAQIYPRHLGIDDSTGQDTDVLQLLLSEGVEPTGALDAVFTESWDGLYEPQSALELVVISGNRLALDILTQVPYHWGAKALGRALVVACSIPREDLVDPILQRNPNMNEEVGFCRYLTIRSASEGPVSFSTALQVAARLQNVSVVRKLLGFTDTDVDYPAKGHFGRTALQHAVENGNLELITVLLNHDADINSPAAEEGGATALQLAAMMGYLGIARRLLDLGADVNAAGAATKGRTALEGAAEHGQIDMVHMLLDEGALILGDAGEGQYENAVQRARGNGHYVVARMLERFRTKMEQAHVQSGISVDGGGGSL